MARERWRADSWIWGCHLHRGWWFGYPLQPPIYLRETRWQYGPVIVGRTAGGSGLAGILVEVCKCGNEKCMGASLTAETRRRGGGERGAGFGTLGLGTRASVWCAKFEGYQAAASQPHSCPYVLEFSQFADGFGDDRARHAETLHDLGNECSAATYLMGRGFGPLRLDQGQVVDHQGAAGIEAHQQQSIQESRGWPERVGDHLCELLDFAGRWFDQIAVLRLTIAIHLKA